MRLPTTIAALALVGCALPPPPDSFGDDDDEAVDAGSGDDDDLDLEIDAAPRPDARDPGGGELTHSSSMLIVPDNSIACTNDDETTAENSFYRVFALSEFDITGPFAVGAVELGVDQATGGGDNTQTVQVRLHTLSGSLAAGTLTQLASTDVTVANVTAALLRAEFNDVSVPAGSTLAVEVHAPDGANGDHTFFIGSNPGGQTGPSYIRAPECGDTQPRDLADIGYPNMHIVMRVLGSG